MKPPTRAPFYATLYHGLCEIARARGYALAIHGTVTTDLDLIACPWTAEAVPAEELRDALMQHIGALDYEGLTRRQFPDNEDLVQQILQKERERKQEPHDETGACLKPHGRRAWNLYMDHGAKVDLSVMPRLSAQWVAVADGMPRNGQRVLAVCLNGVHMWRTVAEYWAAGTMDASEWDDPPEDWWDEAGNNCTNPAAGWWESPVEGETKWELSGVSHWMPLPALQNIGAQP